MKRGCKVTIIYKGQLSQIACISHAAAMRVFRYWCEANGHKNADDLRVSFAPIPRVAKRRGK